MNSVFLPELDKFVIVFIDDILVYSENKKDHEDNNDVMPFLFLPLRLMWIS
jgi:hypothetical protein